MHELHVDRFQLAGGTIFVCVIGFFLLTTNAQDVLPGMKSGHIGKGSIALHWQRLY